MLKNLKKKILLLSFFFVPTISIANGADFKSVSKNLYTNIFSSIIDLLLASAFVFFAWGVFKFIFSEGEKKTEAKDTLFWGVVAIFVMVSFWGILSIVNKTFTEDNLGENKHYNFESDYKKYTPPVR